jgi:predicted nucleotidyltransferase component of viral defense system
MHPEILDQTMLLLSNRMGFLKSFSFYLAGGTGLALQLGHRKSVDLDFFTRGDFAPEDLSAMMKNHDLLPEGEIRGRGTLHCILEGIKSSFISYDSLLHFPLLELNSLDIADWRDITTEKLRIVADRGQKKDFYDLYFGVQLLGIDSLVELSFKKFAKNVNYFHLLKGLTYFEDAEKNPEPMIIDESVTWDNVKNFFLTHIRDFEIAFGKVL